MINIRSVGVVFFSTRVASGILKTYLGIPNQVPFTVQYHSITHIPNTQNGLNITNASLDYLWETLGKEVISMSSVPLKPQTLSMSPL